MKKQILVVALISAIGLGNAGIAYTAEPGKETVAPVVVKEASETAKDIEVTLSAENKPVQMEKGTLLKVSVEGNITTGFGWEIENFNPSLLELTASDYLDKTNSGEKMMEGAPGMQTYVFRAKKTGTSQIVFWYKQPWMDGAPEKSYTLNVEIK